MTLTEILEEKYSKRKEDESVEDYVRRIVKVSEKIHGFTNVHNLLRQKFKEMGYKGKELTNKCIKITDNERDYAKALASI